MKTWPRLAAIVLLHTWCECAESDATKAEPDTSREVASFVFVPGEEVHMTARRIAKASGLVFGIEIIQSSGRTLGGPTEWKRLENASIASLLDFLVRKFPGYEWGVGNGVVHVRPIKQLRGAGWPLDQKLQNAVQERGETIEELLRRLWRENFHTGPGDPEFRAFWCRESRPLSRRLQFQNVTFRDICDRFSMRRARRGWQWVIEEQERGRAHHLVQYFPIDDERFDPEAKYHRLMEGLRQPDKSRAVASLNVLVCRDYHGANRSLNYEVGKAIEEALGWKVNAADQLCLLGCVRRYVLNTHSSSPPYDRGIYMKKLVSIAQNRNLARDVRAMAIRVLGLMGAVQAAAPLIGIRTEDEELRTVTDCALRFAGVRALPSPEARAREYVTVLARLAGRESLNALGKELSDLAVTCLGHEQLAGPCRDAVLQALRDAHTNAKNSDAKRRLAGALARLGDPVSGQP